MSWLWTYIILLVIFIIYIFFTQHYSTPLHWASRYGNLEAVRILLRYKQTDPNVKDYAGNTALHWAVEQGHVEIAAYLLQLKKFTVVNDSNNVIFAFLLSYPCYHIIYRWVKPCSMLRLRRVTTKLLHF